MQTKADHFAPDLALLSEQAKALAHPARLEILRVLARRDECICGEVVDELPLAQASVSRHLKTLKQAGLVQGTVEGPSVCYCLNERELRALQDRLGQFFDDLDLSFSQDDCC
jgi:ArsR family transcriptional regulator